MKIAVLLVGVAVGLYLLDRFLLSCESRGWIYYRTKKASPGSASPFLDLLTIYSPSQRHVLERRMDEQEERQDEDKDGGRLDDDTDGAPSTDQQA